MFAFYWNPKPEVFTVPWVNWPILWYGLLFALGFIIGFPLFVSVVTRYFHFQVPSAHRGAFKKQATALADRLTAYMVLATILGARLGHYLFYERPADYLKDPWSIFRIWEGGLASHGAVVAILIALLIFRRRIRRIYPQLTTLRLLDCLTIPAALAACCIRIGNFINQEILGTPTQLPWAVTFGHPADGSTPIPRHPVQLYEALFYLGMCFILWKLSLRKQVLCKEGALAGILLTTVFSFRFLIEFLKEEQSHLMGDFGLTMGQLLSIPLAALGIALLVRRRSWAG